LLNEASCPEESDASTATAYGLCASTDAVIGILSTSAASLPDPMTVTAPFSPSFVAAKLNALLIVLPAHELLMARSGKPASTASARYSYALMVSALSIVFCLPATLTATSCTPDATPLVPTPSHCDAMMPAQCVPW